MKSERHCSFSVSRVSHPPSWRLLVMLAVLALGLPGCRPAGAPTKTTDHTGTYTLDTINGRKLPFNPLPRIATTEFSSGAITLQADGSFVATASYRASDGTVTRRDTTGSYTKEGSSFRLEYKDRGAGTATLEGNAFTVNDGDLKLVYRK